MRAAADSSQDGLRKVFSAKDAPFYRFVTGSGKLTQAAHRI
jgi:hypothetical protein